MSYLLPFIPRRVSSYQVGFEFELAFSMLNYFDLSARVALISTQAGPVHNQATFAPTLYHQALPLWLCQCPGFLWRT